MLKSIDMVKIKKIELKIINEDNIFMEEENSKYNIETESSIKFF